MRSRGTLTASIRMMTSVWVGWVWIAFLPSSTLAQAPSAADPATGCPVHEQEFPCGDAVYGGCPVSECRRLLRQVAYAPAGEKEALKDRYGRLCVDDGECRTLEHGLRSLLGSWSEMLRQAEASCSPEIDHASLDSLEPLPEKCRGSSIAGLHLRLRRLRCQILQENGRDCPEKVPCPVTPELAKAMLTPERRLCPFVGDGVVEIFRCHAGAEHAHVGALCPPERDAAAATTGACQPWATLDVAQWEERLGAADLVLLDTLPVTTAPLAGWLAQLGGAAPAPGLRLSSRQAWSIAGMSTTPPIFVLMADADGAVYGGDMPPGGEAVLERLEGWRQDDLFPSKDCPEDETLRHHCDWRTVQRELLRFERGMRPFVVGDVHALAGGGIESSRCFADPAALSSMRCLSLRTDPLDRESDQLDPNLVAWQPLRTDWLRSNPPDPDAAQRVVGALSRSAGHFHVIAFGDDDRALVTRGGQLGVFAEDGGAWQFLPTGVLLQTVLPKLFETSPVPDLEAARRLVGEQLALPSAALLDPPSAHASGRTCWLAQAGVLHCFDDAASRSVPFDADQVWARGTALRASAEGLRARLYQELDAADHPMAPPLRALQQAAELDPVVDVLRLGDDWSMVRAVSDGAVRAAACHVELRLEFPQGASPLEFIAWHGAGSGAAVECDAVLRQHYASMERYLEGPLYPRRRLAPLGLISSPPSQVGDLSGIVGLAYHENGALRFLLFPRKAVPGATLPIVGPYDWSCVRREAQAAGFGTFGPDLPGFADLVRCLGDESHPCRTNNIQSPGIWLSGASTANQCIQP
ncbi:MAG: hypothetical protein MPN21_24245 [Thermoanaerobaculia bacterium]|nr:hypothetical protein [Thermoanaerobaculia bacterium]